MKAHNVFSSLFIFRLGILGRPISIDAQNVHFIDVNTEKRSNPANTYFNVSLPELNGVIHFSANDSIHWPGKWRRQAKALLIAVCEDIHLKNPI
jgi:hypothetical protein